MEGTSAACVKENNMEFQFLWLFMCIERAFISADLFFERLLVIFSLTSAFFQAIFFKQQHLFVMVPRKFHFFVCLTQKFSGAIQPFYVPNLGKLWRLCFISSLLVNLRCSELVRMLCANLPSFVLKHVIIIFERKFKFFPIECTQCGSLSRSASCALIADKPPTLRCLLKEWAQSEAGWLNGKLNMHEISRSL